MIKTLYLVHHSHTDIGYNHDQPVIWELHRRYLSDAVELAWTDRDRGDDAAFRWSVETTTPLRYWLDHATPEARERLRTLNASGRVAVGCMALNITPLYDTAELIESLRPVHTLRETYGFNIRYGLNCDVNGQNWPLVDVLLDAGIEGFGMAINEHLGGAPFAAPNPFWWEGPSGRRILAWNGWIYGYMARHSGVGKDAAVFEEWLARVERYLQGTGYSLPILLLQVAGDNQPVRRDLAPFVNAWNAAGKAPRLRLSNLDEWFDALKAHGDEIPTCRGDWTDYWNFGSISSAREVAFNRESRTRLIAADGLHALTQALPAAAGTADDALHPRLRDQAWSELLLFDEHTWGANVSVREPESDAARVQWLHKAHNAAQAVSVSRFLLGESAARLTRAVARDAENGVLVFNPLPWTRAIYGAVPGSDRVLPPTEIPAFGYRSLVPETDAVARTQDFTEDAVIDDGLRRLVFDRERGGIASWWDAALGRELVDRTAAWPLGTMIHECVADREHANPRRLFYRSAGTGLQGFGGGWQRDWRAERHPARRLLSHRVFETPAGCEVLQSVEVDGLNGPVRLRFFLPRGAAHIECDATWTMGLQTHPESLYWAFPFDVPGASSRFDLGPQAVLAERDQLPGTCRDYVTVQRWVDFSNDDFGVTIACPINPLVQLGDFHFGCKQEHFELERALFLGWLTNNYWGTNFRAHQPGEVRARYGLLPHRGPFDEARAHRFGLEAAVPPVFQSLRTPVEQPVLPPSDSLLELPDLPAVVLDLRTADPPGTCLVTLIWAADEPGTATLGPAALRFGNAARCDLFGRAQSELPLEDGRVALPLKPRELCVVRLEHLVPRP